MKDKKVQLRLYITENAPHSNRAIVNLKSLCEKSDHQDLDYEILDIHKHAELATKDQIQVVPTLLKINGRLSVRVIGDLSNHEWIKKELKLV